MQRLTDAKCRNAKPKEKGYRLSDGHGLHLFVTPKGGKYWRYRTENEGKEKIVSLGGYPALALAEARIRHADIRSGKPEADIATQTFAEAAEAWHHKHIGTWAAHHGQEVIRSLRDEIFPALGNVPLGKITPVMVLDALQPMEERRAFDTASRVRARIAAVFDHAIAKGQASVNPAANIKKAMIRVPKNKLRPAIVVLADVRKLLADVEQMPAHPSVRIGMRLLAMTALRPGELRKSTWSEIQGLGSDDPMWRIPAVRMKGRTHDRALAADHDVPLAPQAVEAIEALRTVTGNCPYVFPSRTNVEKCLSENAFGDLLERAGYLGRHCAHGWRSSFSTIMNERHIVLKPVIDLMLAHIPKDPVEAAYNRAQYLTHRRNIAHEWANLLLEGRPSAAELLNLPRRRA